MPSQTHVSARCAEKCRQKVQWIQPAPVIRGVSSTTQRQRTNDFTKKREQTPSTLAPRRLGDRAGVWPKEQEWPRQHDRRLP